jgi:AcrR family transcriptional regulator
VAQETVEFTAGLPRKRLSPGDWIDAAMEVLLSEGHSGLRIKHLARRLGVTPGSFYWHFRDRDQLRDRMLEHWMSQMLRRAAAAAEMTGKGADQLRALPDILMARGLPNVDAAMRRWASQDPIVAEAVAGADGLRSRVVAAMFGAAGFGSDVAEQRAKLLGWAFRGSSGVDDGERSTALRALVEALLRDAP